jgi:transposase-like protein
MIATELAQRYSQGGGLKSLAREFGLAPRTVAKTLRAMGVVIRPAGFGKPSAAFLAAQRAGKIRAREEGRTPGTYCARCQILLAAAPAGDAGLCGWCASEGR